MKIRNTLPTLLLCLLLCTGCANIPEPDAEVSSDPTTAAPTDASGSAEETETTSAPTETNAAETSGTTGIPEDSTEGAQDGTEEDTTEAEARLPWQEAYRIVLRKCYGQSAHEDSYFALIRLDADEIPELVILDGVEMALYCFDGTDAVLLLEDAYKSSAVMEQNVCYQPEKSLFSTKFSTMGAGSGFTVFSYPELDAAQAERFYFDNNENVNGEMPYNAIWDRAEEFEVSDNGYHDVTLGSSWVQIGTDFADLWKLTQENADQVGNNWDPSADEADGES